MGCVMRNDIIEWCIHRVAFVDSVRHGRCGAFFESGSQDRGSGEWKFTTRV